MRLELVGSIAPLEERDLIAACLRGDRNAERELFRREYPRVNATVCRVLGSTRDADDIVQETFIAVFRALKTFRGDAKLSTWIDRIAVRAVFHHIGANKRSMVSLESVPDLLDERASPAEQADAREGLRRMYAALARLKPDARTAFALYAIDGRSIAEVAQLMETTAITAKVRIWRARRTMAAHAAADPVLASFIAAARTEEEP